MHNLMMIPYFSFGIKSQGPYNGLQLAITYLTSCPITTPPTLAALTLLLPLKHDKNFKFFAITVPSAWNILPPDILCLTPSPTSSFYFNLTLLMRPLLTTILLSRKHKGKKKKVQIVAQTCMLVRIIILLK